MAERPAYAAGPPGQVIHHTGARFNRSECEAIRAYIKRELANPSWSRESQAARARDLASLEAAMAQSFTKEREPVA